jgi:hypothetical protein
MKTVPVPDQNLDIYCMQHHVDRGLSDFQAIP